MRAAISRLLLVGALCGACGDDEETKTSTYDIEPKSGNTTLGGTVQVLEKSGKITITVAVTGAPEGTHGLHIHETGDCTAPDAMSAGGHWNPDGHMHGRPDAESHLGDLGNLTVAADGTGKLTLSKSEWTLGDGAPSDLFGKAIVVHAMPDDFSQPTGASGARIGCSVIEKI